MLSLRTPRIEPYVWTTWLSKILAGEASCTWSVWLRAHYQTTKAASRLELGTWQMEHSAMLRKAVTDHEQQNYEVYAEDQNLFTLKGKVGTLSGKPDVVAVKDKHGWIVDSKTGSPKGSDRIQVMVYMWAIRRANPKFADVAFDGKVVYRTGYNLITADEVDSVFIGRVADLMREVCGTAEPHKAPSYKECQFCPVSHEDCAERVDEQDHYSGETDEF